MKTISIINLKGGVGKTVTTVNMAAILAAEHGKWVLVIDADPQANTTAFFNCCGEECDSMAEIMSGDADYIYDYICHTRLKNVSCVPADISLIEADIASVRTGGGTKKLSGFLELVDEANASFADAGEDIVADYVIIDCPPSFTAASVAALAASDYVIIPVKIDAFALSGLRELLGQIEGIKKTCPEIKIAGILVTMWRKSPAVAQGEELLRAAGLPVFKTHIRHSEKVVESTFSRNPLLEYSPRSSASRDYCAFVAEFLKGSEVNG